VAGTKYMPHVYFPANSAKSELTSSIEADARTHSSIASASGVFTTQHVVTDGRESAPVTLPQGTALIGLSVYASAPAEADTTITLIIGGKATALKMLLSKGETTKYQAFALGEYASHDDFLSGGDKPVAFVCEPETAGSGQLHLVAFWRSNRLPVF